MTTETSRTNTAIGQAPPTSYDLSPTKETASTSIGCQSYPPQRQHRPRLPSFAPSGIKASQGKGATDILKDALDLAYFEANDIETPIEIAFEHTQADNEDVSLTSNCASDNEDDCDVAVKFDAISLSDDYYGSRKISRSTPAKPTTEKRDLLMDDMRIFQYMIDSACVEEEDDCTSCSDEESDYYEGSMPVNFSTRLPTLLGGAPQKREMLLDNMDTLRGMLHAYRYEENELESFSSDEEEENEFVFTE